MEKSCFWQISQRSRIMNEVSEERERLGDKFFAIADHDFENTGVDLRAVAGLLVGGICHMVLHGQIQ